MSDVTAASLAALGGVAVFLVIARWLPPRASLFLGLGLVAIAYCIVRL